MDIFGNMQIKYMSSHREVTINNSQTVRENLQNAKEERQDEN